VRPSFGSDRVMPPTLSTERPRAGACGQQSLRISTRWHRPCPPRGPMMEGLPMQATCPFTPLAGMVPEPPYNRRYPPFGWRSSRRRTAPDAAPGQGHGTIRIAAIGTRAGVSTSDVRHPRGGRMRATLAVLAAVLVLASCTVRGPYYAGTVVEPPARGEGDLADDNWGAVVDLNDREVLGASRVIVGFNGDELTCDDDSADTSRSRRNRNRRSVPPTRRWRRHLLPTSHPRRRPAGRVRVTGRYPQHPPHRYPASAATVCVLLVGP